MTTGYAEEAKARARLAVKTQPQTFARWWTQMDTGHILDGHYDGKNLAEAFAAGVASQQAEIEKLEKEVSWLRQQLGIALDTLGIKEGTGRSAIMGTESGNGS